MNVLKNIINGVVENGKLEILSIVAGVFFYFSPVSVLKYSNWTFSLEDYFIQDRLNGIATFFSITIGIYVAVITVLAMSEIGLSKEILERKLDKALINVMVIGIIEDLITVGMAIFVPGNKVAYYILLFSIILSIISFVKFIILMVEVFKKNMDQIAKNIDAEEEYKNDVLSNLEQITRNMKNNK